jgi:hypothetical protein
MTKRGIKRAIRLCSLFDWYVVHYDMPGADMGMRIEVSRAAVGFAIVRALRELAYKEYLK